MELGVGPQKETGHILNIKYWHLHSPFVSIFRIQSFLKSKVRRNRWSGRWEMGKSLLYFHLKPNRINVLEMGQ
jgi:hypothetical protein